MTLGHETAPKPANPEKTASRISLLPVVEGMILKFHKKTRPPRPVSAGMPLRLPGPFFPTFGSQGAWDSIGIGKIPASFTAKSGRDGAGFGDFGFCLGGQLTLNDSH